VLDGYAAAHPEAPRVTIGDISRPRGGPFGKEFGFPGHASHQNGLDIDIYYPRRDRSERAARTVAQVDRRLSQDLVNRFVAIGAVQVYVGRKVRLTGPRRVVVPLWRYHENHLHVRLRPGAACRR
jgi:murein endopeptidase